MNRPTLLCLVALAWCSSAAAQGVAEYQEWDTARFHEDNSISGPWTSDCYADGDPENPPYRGFTLGYAMQGSGTFLPRTVLPNQTYTVEVLFKRDDFPVQASERVYISIDLPSTAPQGTGEVAWTQTLTYQFTTGPDHDSWGDITINAGHNGDAYYYNTFVDRVRMWEGTGGGPDGDDDGDGCPNDQDPEPLDPEISCNCVTGEDSPWGSGQPDEDCDGCPDAEAGINCGCVIAGVPDSDCDGLDDDEDEDDDGDGCPDACDANPTSPDPNTAPCDCGCDEETDADCDDIPNEDDDDDDGDGCPDSNDPAPLDPAIGCACDDPNDTDCDGCPDAQDPSPGDPDGECNCDEATDSDCDGCPNEHDQAPNEPGCGDLCLNDQDCDGCPDSQDPQPTNPAVGCDGACTGDADCDGCPDQLDAFPQDPTQGCEGACENDADCDGCLDQDDEFPQDPSQGCEEEPHCCNCCCSQCQGGGEPPSIEPGNDNLPFEPEWEPPFELLSLEPHKAAALAVVPTDVGTRDYQTTLDFSVDYEGRDFFDGWWSWSWIPSEAGGWDPETIALLAFWLPLLKGIIAIVIWIEFGQYVIKTFARW